ncbi:extracellular solute-binding protein [Halovenus halobia]|uniref:extracellular solute-binding protein n=1 Tax=Halovenus halobia TaxID=3396622 RepID=UPI003F545374
MHGHTDSDETAEHRAETETAGGHRSRRAVLAAGGAAMAASAGCLGLIGNDSGPGEDGFGEPGQMTADDGTITINFWPAWGGYYEETVRSMVSEFEENNSNIKINLNLLTNYRDSRTTAFTNIEGGNPADMPDITHFNTADSILARDTGWFQPIEGLMSDVSPDDIIEPAAATSTIEGTMWGAPFYISNIVMHYNADMLAEAGYDPANPPQSLAEVREMGEAAVNQTGAEYGVTIPNAAWFLTCWIAEQNEFWMDEENGHAGEPTTVYASEDYTLEPVQWWADMAADGLYFNGGIENWSEPTSVFRQGRVPFNLNSSTSVAYVNSDSFDMRTAMFPTLSGDRIGHHRGGAEIWAVNKARSDEEREAMQKFVDFALSPEQQAAFHKASGYYPAHQGSWDVLESEGWFEDNPRYQVAREQIQNWERHPTNIGTQTGESPAISAAVASEMNEVFGGKDPQAAMKTVKEEAEAALARYQRQA